MKRLLTLAALLPSLALMAQNLNPVRIGLTNWATGLDSPLLLANCGDDRLFVVERAGTIRIITDSMEVAATPFLDITSSVNDAQNEQGLLGLAFDPGYLENGFFYVYYIAGTGAGSSRISRFSVTADPNVADPTSEVILFTIPQPYWNHNGGCLQFGPDGYLYCGFGDGGSGDDPNNNGQTLANVLGDMIRLDVSQHDDTYLIPADNPWATVEGDTLPEIWASGLRNPWRYTFDRLTGDLWIGDVGQNAWEEVDFWPAGDNSGPNFGWRCREGLVATPGVSQVGCGSAADYVAPVAVFNHSSQDWCSVIGGYVYRGTQYPHLYGHYIYTDYCAGDFLTFGDAYDVDTMLMSTTFGYAGFGENLAGEMFIANVENGQVKKIYDACPMDDPTITLDGATFTSSDANSYQWYLNGTLIPGATAQEYVAVANGMYHVVANYGSPCLLRSEALEMTTIGVVELLGASQLMVSPQPAQNIVRVTRNAAMTAAVQLDFVDATGRSLRSFNWPANQASTFLDVADVANGTYVLRGIGSNGALFVAAIVVAH